MTLRGECWWDPLMFPCLMNDLYVYRCLKENSTFVNIYSLDNWLMTTKFLLSHEPNQILPFFSSFFSFLSCYQRRSVWRTGYLLHFHISCTLMYYMQSSCWTAKSTGPQLNFWKFLVRLCWPVGLILTGPRAILPAWAATRREDCTWTVHI